MDVNTLYRVTGQRGEQIAENDETHQMKASHKLCFFWENRIKSCQRERFSTVIRKKIASAKRRITSIYTGMITVVPHKGHDKNAFPSGTSFWFSVTGIVAIIMAFLKTENAVVLTTAQIRGESVLECNLVWEYLNIWVFATKTCVCTPERVWAKHWLM